AALPDAMTLSAIATVLWLRFCLGVREDVTASRGKMTQFYKNGPESDKIGREEGVSFSNR
ncbi:MAG: hypothetical protein AAGC68_14040, partial [Verrucomicrobiota bacterium]